jgi:Polyketide cyclase / dehydrase and lipid transport
LDAIGSPADLVHLGCHHEVVLCGGCIGWLAERRARGSVRRAVPILARTDVNRARARTKSTRRPPAGCKSGLVRGVRTLVYAAVVGGVGYRLLAGGQITLDSGVGRTLRPLGPITVAMAAPRDTVFDVIAAPYLGRTPRAIADEIEVLERGSDMVLAAHRTPVGGGIVTTTVETVRFDRPETIDFRLVRGPVPHVIERFTLHSDQGATRLEYTGELGADFWGLGRWWAHQVATKWEATVRGSLDRIRTEAERRAS